ncbi:hypothetical protein EF847_01400 [Actinobacteria bacterium YIM 96077]|uniref:Winged helix-turn helix domain-containing protein n=1 Tax=Phytoactinopolyspora halophila TaxID=1981511 RepID=A0A329QF95_9ACTN|nr:hypothetical protein [Phytoactinopolyspora halophila]AYY11577.1 hypothetical protein EF847_01400 [Actinobacteria bacterium YIM 96077]RAW11123.1 hypothetical protein DPM12_17425 [Phytoactinopolyspora halophila]
MRERTVPEDWVLQQWHAEGLSVAEMVDRIETETGEKVTSEAVRWHLRRLGLLKRARTLPWEMSADDRRRYKAQLIKWAFDREAGVKLSERHERLVDKFLDECRQEQVVWAYSASLGLKKLQRSTVPQSKIHPTLPIVTVGFN